MPLKWANRRVEGFMVFHSFIYRLGSEVGALWEVLGKEGKVEEARKCY